MKHLVEGKIPAHTACFWAKQCAVAQAGQCNHNGVNHKIPFSCGFARAFQIFGTPVDVVTK